ncbi:MAG: MarC family protein [Saprospiraceae bacterium]|jgi:multiple antibiotic resistance protein|nr:MarC family protein [Saprospiraceae bacterium]MBP9193757.1 MarC family protein [Saprospiraceae bacterium]
MDAKNILSVSLILFSVIDIIGSLPIIIDLKEKGNRIESAKAAAVSLVLMVTFLYVGDQVLKLFGVDIPSFAVAGSIILFIISFEMILGITLFKEEKKVKKATIVPVAFPLVAGAGTMTTIISLKAKFDNIEILTGIVINIFLVYLVLKSSDYLKDKLSPSFINVLRKMFGIILLAIAVKLFRDNFHLYIATGSPVQ